MKGIVHMLEAILVSLTFMMIVPFLLYPFIFPSDWDRTQMLLNGQDLLASLDKVSDSGASFLQNIMQKNSSELESDISMNFVWLENRRMNYGIMSVGTIPNEIRVGFNCTGTSCMGGTEQGEIDYLESILRPTFVNGRYVSFYVFPFSYDSLGRQDMDVIFIRGEDQRNEAEDEIDTGPNNAIDVLLNRGTGIVGFYYIQNINPSDDLESEILGLRMGAAPGGTEIMSFVNTNNASKPNYAIQKYFYGVGINENFTYKWDEHNETTIKLWGSNYKVRRNDTDLDGDYDSLDLDTDGDGLYERIGKGEDYQFTITSPAPVLGYDFIVEKIDSEGRFFTLNFNRTTPYNFTKIGNRPIRPDKPNEMDYVVLQSGNNKAALVVNGSDETTWRTVWISDENNGNDVSALLKSSIIWASERSWWNVARSSSMDNLKTIYFVSQGNEFLEPFWVELNLWYVY